MKLGLTEKQISQKEVTKVVALHRQLEVVFGDFPATTVAQSSVEDQDVKRPFFLVDLGCEGSHGVQRRQVQALHDDVFVSGRLTNLLCEGREKVTDKGQLTQNKTLLAPRIHLEMIETEDSLSDYKSYQ